MDAPCSSRGSSSGNSGVGRRHKVLARVGDRRNQFLDTFFVRITHSCEAQVLFGLVLLLFLVFVVVERNRIPGYTSPFARVCVCVHCESSLTLLFHAAYAANLLRAASLCCPHSVLLHSVTTFRYLNFLECGRTSLFLYVPGCLSLFD